MTLHTSAAEGGSARDVEVTFRARSLLVALGGRPVVNGPLTEAVHPEECTWQFGALPYISGEESDRDLLQQDDQHWG